MISIRNTNIIIIVLYYIMSQSISINILKDGSHNSYASAESNSELNAYVVLQ